MGENTIFCMEIIIHGVLSRPFLYNKFHPEFQEVHKKRQAFVDIAESVNKFNQIMDIDAEPITGNGAESTWNSLLNDFKEARKQTMKHKSGDGAKTTSFPFMKEMSFMEPILEQKQVWSTLNQNKEIGQFYQQQPSTSSGRKRPLQAPDPDVNASKKKRKTTADIEKMNSQMSDILDLFKNKMIATPASAQNASSDYTSSTPANSVNLSWRSSASANAGNPIRPWSSASVNAGNPF
ncbi:hypothetical protein TKK_0019132 [Trichogramma kaykai]|uniref:MADF domain-containing protein n=1 Tax=Trichogramma kaykai TaxID=54128 RepID=A0ABD2VUC4_9HYME